MYSSVSYLSSKILLRWSKKLGLLSLFAHRSRGKFLDLARISISIRI